LPPGDIKMAHLVMTSLNLTKECMGKMNPPTYSAHSTFGKGADIIHPPKQDE